MVQTSHVLLVTPLSPKLDELQTDLVKVNEADSLGNDEGGRVAICFLLCE